MNFVIHNKNVENQRGFRSGVAAVVAVVAAFSAWVIPATAAPKAPAIAEVTGPVTAGQHGRPFTAFLGDIGRFGYVEEEFFLSGQAVGYKLLGEQTTDGKWTIEPDRSQPYKTRILVRRPRDPAKFNGTIIVEWLNVSAGLDINLLGDGIYHDSGFAYVGVSAQVESVHGFPSNPMGLRNWDPQRYDSLSIPAAGISYDIFTQAARAVGPNRPQGGVDPMGGLTVKKLIATGGSQSAGRLVSYINGVQPREKVFDAFVPLIARGYAIGFDDMVIDPAKLPPADVIKNLLKLGFHARDDQQTPVMIVNSECETLNYHASRRPDTERFRYWEVAGASHVPGPTSRESDRMWERDQIKLPFSKGKDASEVMWEPTADAAFRHVHRWVNGGPPPPSQPRIEVSNIDGKLEVVRDEFGNAKGGVRLPELEVPVARYDGANDAAGPLNRLTGRTTPFAPDVLKRLYPTHAEYVRKVTAAAEAAERDGGIAPWRVREYVADAQKAKFE